MCKLSAPSLNICLHYDYKLAKSADKMDGPIIIFGFFIKNLVFCNIIFILDVYADNL